VTDSAASPPETSDRKQQLAQMLEKLSSDPSQLTVKLGVEFVQLDPERVVATMPVAGNKQPFGLLHGGASAALAETLGTAAAMMACPPDTVAVGLDLNITHHRSPRGAAVTAICTPLHVGRTVAAFEIAIYDDATGTGEGARISTARLSCAIIPGARVGQATT
jgi:1,4-dihydroxy-2-naphthoyl-CoA hydrolase